MRAPTVSIITALAERPAPRLPEIHAVLAAVREDWEWLLQVDGDGEGPRTIPPKIRDDPRVAIERNGRQLGIAATRNRALARARGPLLLNVDSDDLPREAAFSALAPVFADSSLGLAFGDWVEHWPDREPWNSSVRFAPGRLAPGTLSRIWSEERWVPMHLAGAMWRSDAVLAAGGWTATVGGSDIGLMLGVDADWASAYVPITTFTYFHHPEQVTASRAWQAQFDLDMLFLERRRRALAAIHVDRLPGG